MENMYDKNILIFNASVFHYAFDILKSICSKSAALLSENISENQTLHIEIDGQMQKLGAALFIPTVVNGTFACEILLKSMLSEVVKCHKLDYLFEKLDNEIKEEILREMIENMNQNCDGGYVKEQFYNDLRKNGDIFEKWRYFYEGKCGFADLNFITCFLETLKKVSAEKGRHEKEV